MTAPIISQMLATQMTFTTERQGILAQNMANIDTPHYTAQDLRKPDFSEMARQASSPTIAMASTNGGKSLSGTIGGNDHFKADKIHKSFEVTPSGNNVELEEQMGKISDTGAQFQIASSLYRKFNSLYNIAVSKNR